MTIEDRISDEKLQYDINGEVAKISALSSGTNDKYKYLTGGGKLPFNKRHKIEQTKFAYSLLGKTFEKQTEKRIGAIKSLGPFNKLKRIEGIFP